MRTDTRSACDTDNNSRGGNKASEGLFYRLSRFMCQAGRAGPRIQPRQAGVIENMGGCVSDFLHGEPYAAGFLIDTLVAAAIGRQADARDEGQWTFQDADHLADGDVARLTRQHVSASSAFLAVENA